MAYPPRSTNATHQCPLSYPSASPRLYPRMSRKSRLHTRLPIRTHDHEQRPASSKGTPAPHPSLHTTTNLASKPERLRRHMHWPEFPPDRTPAHTTRCRPPRSSSPTNASACMLTPPSAHSFSPQGALKARSRRAHGDILKRSSRPSPPASRSSSIARRAALPSARCPASARPALGGARRCRCCLPRACTECSKAREGC